MLYNLSDYLSMSVIFKDTGTHTTSSAQLLPAPGFWPELFAQRSSNRIAYIATFVHPEKRLCTDTWLGWVLRIPRHVRNDPRPQEVRLQPEKADR